MILLTLTRLLSKLVKCYFRRKTKIGARSVMCMSQDPWSSHLQYKMQTLHQVSHSIDLALIDRTETIRDQVEDDKLFMPLNKAMARAIAHKDYLFAIKLFQQSFEHAVAHEKERSTEIHKGAMAFNAGLCYLRIFDFVAAMHFLGLAQEEDRKTTGNSNWQIYEGDLFKDNFWSILQLFEKDEPLSIYNELWGVGYGDTVALADWRELSPNSKLGYIIALAERLRYIELAKLSPWNKSESLRLAYWHLLGDLTRILETELRNKGLQGRGLLSIILSSMPENIIHNFRNRVGDVQKQCGKAGNIPAFNKSYPLVKQIIQDETLSWEDRVIASSFLAGICRNQVQHQVDDNCILFANVDDARFTSEVLIALCRVRGWVG